MREEASVTRTTGQAATDPFVAIVHRERGLPTNVPVVYGRNPNSDFRNQSPARSPSPVRAPPGQSVPGMASPNVGLRDARTAADSLPWADSRAERRLAAATRSSVSPAITYADHVRMPQGEAIWSPLDQSWIYPTGSSSSRITRSRSPPPRLRQHHDARHQGPSSDHMTYEPCD